MVQKAAIRKVCAVSSTTRIALSTMVGHSTERSRRFEGGKQPVSFVATATENHSGKNDRGISARQVKKDAAIGLPS